MLKHLHPAQVSGLRYRPLLKLSLVVIVTILLITSASSSFGQQNKGYSLLWKISGKGLTKPSYLFGTMHVKDKRAFGFSDSVMVSIQRCSAFALEVHPDSLIKAAFDQMGERDTSLNLKKLLSKEDYEALAKRFEDKNGYPIDGVNPLSVETLVKHKTEKPDDRNTFVDAYLYGIARTMNKTIYGLEDGAQQVKDIYGSADKLRDRLKDVLTTEESDIDNNEDMLAKVYSTGNLDTILSFVKRYDLNKKDIIARNKVMLNSILSQLAVQNIFVAVGVAHLPGDDGLIDLLRKQGYTVTPVNATFTGVADQYKIDYFKMKWETYKNPEDGFSIETPGYVVPATSEQGLNTVIYPDMANDIFYGAYAIKKGNANTKINGDGLIKQFLEYYQKNAVILNKTALIMNGQRVTDFSVKKGHTYLRFQVRVVNNVFYSLYVGNKLENLNQPYSERFFRSFKSFVPEVPKAEDWVDYRNPAGAFKVQMPAQPEPMIKEIPNPNSKNGAPYVINMYMAMDKVNMGVYIVRYNDYPIGNYLANKDVLFEALSKEFEGKGKLLSKPEKIFFNGYEGREVRMMLSDKYYTEIKVYIRGNRTYILLRENLNENATTGLKDNFFSSFAFTPYQEPPYFEYAPEGGNFKVKLVSKPKITPDTVVDHTSFLKNNITLSSTNPNSGGAYSLEYSHISKYYRAQNVDTLYSTLAKQLVSYKDTLLNIDKISFNGKIGRKLIIQNKVTQQKKQKGILIDNDLIFFMANYTANEELTNPAAQCIFNSLTVADTKASFDIRSSKAQLIADDLLSADTVTFKQAKGALSYYNFDKDELPMVYKALQNKYADDTLRNSARKELIDVLEKVHDDKTIETLQALFNDTQTPDRLRAAALRTIPLADKKTGYDIYLKLLTTTPPLKVDNYYEIFNPLNDSLEYAAANFKTLLPLIGNDNYRKNMVSVVRNMLDEKKTANTDLIKTNFNAIMQYAGADLDKYLALKDSGNNKWWYTIYNYLQIMTKIKNQPLTDTFTDKVIRLDPKGQVSTAAIARIKNHLPISDRVLNTLMDSIDERYSVMKALYDENQAAKIPLKYKQQSEFARLCFYQNIEDDDSHPEKIVLLGSIADKGVLYYAFRFMMPDRDEKKPYIGITGPFKPGSTKLDFIGIGAYTAFDIKKVNWQLQAKKMIPDLKKQQANNAALSD